MSKRLIVFSTVLFLVSCISPTPYQNVSRTVLHGFVVDKLTDTKYRIVFHGNEDTSQLRADDFTLLKCAQTTIAHGYKYFIRKRHESVTTSAAYVHDKDHGEAIKYRGKNGELIYTNDYATQFGSYKKRFGITRPKVYSVIEFIEHKNSVEKELYEADNIVRSLSKKYNINL